MFHWGLPVIVCGKIVARLQNKTITSMWNTFSVCLFRSAEITAAIFLALHSVSHAPENISGFTGFLSSKPNGQNLTRLSHFFTFTYIPRITAITVYEIIYFWQTLKRTKHSRQMKLNTSWTQNWTLPYHVSQHPLIKYNIYTNEKKENKQKKKYHKSY